MRQPSTTDIHALCDWAEARALITPSRRTTKGDVQAYVRVDDHDHPGEERDAELDEGMADDVMSLAKARGRSLGGRYPFEVSNKVIRARIGKRTTAYQFHLLLSVSEDQNIGASGRHAFEVECLEALRAHFRMPAFHFGWTKVNSDLGKYPQRLARFLKEAGFAWSICEPLPAEFRNANDLGVDVILWKKQRDGRENTLMVFGQCGSGVHWKPKLESRMVERFIHSLSRPPQSPTIRAFCTPFEIPEPSWEIAFVNSNSLIFDRLRLVHESPATNGLRTRDAQKWLNSHLGKLRDRESKAAAHSLRVSVTG
jgi:hypothetical protein